MNERPLDQRPPALPIRITPEPHVEIQLEVPTKNVSGKQKFRRLFFAGVVLAAIGTLGLAAMVPNLFIPRTEDGGSKITKAKPQVSDPRATFLLSVDCESGMAAAAADQSENGETLLMQTGDACTSRAEWEAALFKYPLAIGITDANFLDGSEYDLMCHSYPKVRICKN